MEYENKIENIKLCSHKKAAYITVFCTIAVMLLSIFYFEINIFSIQMISIIIFAVSLWSVVFLFLMLYHRCPRCNKLWAFQYNKDVILDKKITSENGHRYKNQKSLIEYECVICNFIKTKLKKKKERINNE